ncbi:unnamed protein product [Rotaria magnacalcarata]|nr:unnamed protein product [Rotaria magnacalcarata]CAF4555993.1 unnamed protein product [Rotaria magnacalcarata]CAF4656751.1 unnamed protein product [Rotaria magnacalcarata]
MEYMIRTPKFLKLSTRFIIFVCIFICFGTLENNSLAKFNDTHARISAVIVTLISSTDRSVSLTINMIHSVVHFFLVNATVQYPFLIFHDENFTSIMRQQILSCVLRTNKHIQISFALVNFTTSIQPNPGSRLEKSIGYRLMCRFWTYDVFYHPTILQGKYDYLMRMDADSYFSDVVHYDIFHYVKSQNVDYAYRSNYFELTPALDPFLRRAFNGESDNFTCIYNNFFIMRLKWFYKSKEVQRFIHELIDDDLILREYIGDGCIHAAIIHLASHTKVKHLTDISYGHNFHVIPSGYEYWSFNPVKQFNEEISKSYFYRRLISTSIIVFSLFWFFRFWFRPVLISTTQIDTFLNSTLCGRLIRYSDSTLTESELRQLNDEASSFFSLPTDCSLFTRPIRISIKELTYPLAFSIVIHSNLDQLNFLLRTIYRRYNYYCIHVDIKSPLSLYEAVKRYSACTSNIFIPEKRIDVTWGHFSVLEAERLCQKELLNQSTTWKYYLNLANSDIPLKTNFELVQILKLYNNQNDITSLPYRSQLRQKKVLLNRTLPSSIPLPLYKGEFHALLSRPAVAYLHRSSRVADLYEFLNGTSVPDEHFYSIINRWKETPGFYPYNHDLSQVTFMTRYKIWNDRPERHLCRGGFVRGICVFNHQDLWHLATSPHLFANKIFFQRDRLTPYCMAQYLDVRTSIKQEENDFSIIDIDFYKQLNNVQFGKEKQFN